MVSLLQPSSSFPEINEENGTKGERHKWANSHVVFLPISVYPSEKEHMHWIEGYLIFEYVPRLLVFAPWQKKYWGSRVCLSVPSSSVGLGCVFSMRKIEKMGGGSLPPLLLRHLSLLSHLRFCFATEETCFFFASSFHIRWGREFIISLA